MAITPDSHTSGPELKSQWNLLFSAPFILIFFIIQQLQNQHHQNFATFLYTCLCVSTYIIENSFSNSILVEELSEVGILLVKKCHDLCCITFKEFSHLYSSFMVWYDVLDGITVLGWLAILLA